MGSTRRSFTDEYKRDAVTLIVDGGLTVSEVCKKLEVSETTVRKWLKRYRGPQELAPGSELSEAERAELLRLRKEVSHLTLQWDFAKKVSTWFAKGQQ